MQLMCFDSKMVAVPCLLIFSSHCYQRGNKKNKKNKKIKKKSSSTMESRKSVGNSLTVLLNKINKSSSGNLGWGRGWGRIRSSPRLICQWRGPVGGLQRLRFLEGKIVVPLDVQLAEAILKVRRSIFEVVGSLSADVGITVHELVTGFGSGGDSSCHLARRFFSFGP